jgi:hypothetical protein
MQRLPFTPKIIIHIHVALMPMALVPSVPVLWNSCLPLLLQREGGPSVLQFQAFPEPHRLFVSTDKVERALGRLGRPPGRSVCNALCVGRIAAVGPYVRHIASVSLSGNHVQIRWDARLQSGGIR